MISEHGTTASTSISECNRSGSAHADPHRPHQTRINEIQGTGDACEGQLGRSSDNGITIQEGPKVIRRSASTSANGKTSEWMICTAERQVHGVVHILRIPRHVSQSMDVMSPL